LPKLSGENFNPFAAIHYFVETFRYREIYYDRSNGQILRTYQLGVDDTLGKEWKNLGSFFCSAEPTEKDLQRLKQAKYRPTYLQIATPEGQLLADVPVPAGSRILKADESGIWLIRKKPDPQGRLWVYRYAYQPDRARH